MFPPDRQSKPCPDAPDAQSRPDNGDVAPLLAERIKGSGLEAPAAILLRVLKPAYWLGGQALYVAAPFLEALGVGRRSGGVTPGAMAAFLESEQGVERLLERIEGSGGKGEARPGARR
jgi:hypothetical protein